MAMRKLRSPKGTLLGTVTFPDGWDQPLRDRGYIRFEATLPQERYRLTMEMLFADRPPAVPEMVVLGGLSECHGTFDDSVELFSITLERFEQLSGCSFAPSAAYLRSIVEGT